MLRQQAKVTALRTLRAAGYYQLAADSSKRKSKLLILCYHGLSLRDEDQWHGHLYMTAERFRSRMELLRAARANVLSLDEGVKRLQADTLPPRSVVLTFDDGFVDFRWKAVPILREFSYPCTLYLTSYYSGHPLPIINLVLHYLLWKCGESVVTLPSTPVRERSNRTYGERTAIVMDIVRHFESKGLDTEEKDEAARVIAAQFGIDYEAIMRERLFQIMNSDEIKDCHAGGVDIQLHTHRHRTPRQQDSFVREIEENRDFITHVTGRSPNHFCYPSGVHAEQFLPWLRECGVQSATTCERGLAKNSDNPLLLPRVLDDSSMEALQFEAFVMGVLG